MLYRNAFMSLVELHINLLDNVVATDLLGDNIFLDTGAHRTRATSPAGPRMCIIEQFGLDSVAVYAYADAADRRLEVPGGKELHYTLTTHLGLLKNEDSGQEALTKMALLVANFLTKGITINSTK